jgi:hypothetical protein
MATETDLRDWRGGQTNAERLCAGILAINGFVDIDPQAPLGGPDDKKDILAKREGHQYVCAVYFPPTHQTFAAIEKKFLEDREGVARHDADGFVFFVNQPLSLGQRQALQDAGEPLDELFHLERLRLILDSPNGYGLRLEFLRKAMSVEEQISFFSTLHEDLTRQLLKNQRVEEKLDTVIERTTLIEKTLGISDAPSSLESPDVIGSADTSMADISVATIQLLHRAVTDSTPLPNAVRGTLRGVRLWVGDPNNPVYEPPGPEEVPAQLAELLHWWRDNYSVAKKAGLPAVVPSLARLHYGIVAIHPFVDGNGRLARFVTDQAARELLGRGVSEEMTRDRRLYFEALRAGNIGDLSPLESLIRAALT